jgi:uncharacterized protein (DUF58 family)
MLPTRAAVLLFLFSLILIPVGILFPPCRWLLVGYDSGVLLLFLTDAALAYLTFRADVLQVRREKPPRLSLGTANEVVLVLENRWVRSLCLILRDEPPLGFQADAGMQSVTVPPHGTVRLSYQLTPTERGNFQFGDINLRCRGPMGLAWIDRAIPATESVQVYPNLLEVRRYEALLRATLVRAGGYRAKRLPGAGREFSHFRDYTIDDDYRQVNWKATARRAKPITAVFESEHSQDIIFCLDVGRMMAAHVGAMSKLDHAINAILMLTHVSQAFQDNLGLLVFSHSVHRYLPPGKGHAQHALFLQALYSVKPELCYVNYQEAFQYLIAHHPKRALTMVFTDLLDAEVSSEYRDAVRLLRQFHLPLTLAVADVPLQKLAARTPKTVPQMYDVLVARDLLHGRAEMLKSLERQGVMVLDTVPERLTIDAVNRYLALKTGSRL